MSSAKAKAHEPEIDITYGPVRVRKQQAQSASSGSQAVYAKAEPEVPIIKPRLHKYVPPTTKHPPAKPPTYVPPTTKHPIPPKYLNSSPQNSQQRCTQHRSQNLVRWDGFRRRGALNGSKPCLQPPPPKAEAGSGRKGRAKKLVAGTGECNTGDEIQQVKPKSTAGRKKKVVKVIPVHEPDLHYNPDLNDVYFVR